MFRNIKYPVAFAYINYEMEMNVKIFYPETVDEFVEQVITLIGVDIDYVIHWSIDTNDDDMLSVLYALLRHKIKLKE